MDTKTELVPHPRVVQERLAQNYREARILRSLLRLSVKAMELAAQSARQRPQTAAERGGVQ
jgi:hypothetical protein